MVEVFNPANGALIATVKDFSAEEVKEAVGQVTEGFGRWSRMLAKERGALLRAWYEAVKKDKEIFARLMTEENGKCLVEARAEIDYGLDFVTWYAEEGMRVYGDVIPPHVQGAEVLVRKDPVGPVAAITPWNFPFAMITRKVATALGAGCTVVLKPAEDTPLTALKLQEYAEKAGIGRDVFSVVTGDAPMIGEVFTTDPRIAKISFTGSTAVGRRLVAQSAEGLKKVTMELGGNAPFLVFLDADVDAAVKGLVHAKLRNSGQVCIAPNRVLVDHALMERFTEALVKVVQEVKVDQGMQEGFVVGPLINRKGFEKVERLVADAVKKGARVLCGGKVDEKGGLFYSPTVLADVPKGAELYRTEIFGPVFALYSFEGEEEGIAMANDTEFGLVSYAYTRDVGRAFRLSRALESGMVIVNSGAVGTASAPFGGVKQSGFGREGSYYGIEEYVQPKYVLMGGIDA